MLKLGNVVTVKVGDDGRWIAFLRNVSTTSFDDRCAALEWAADRISEELEIRYAVEPSKDHWTIRIPNFSFFSYTTREAALEYCVTVLASKLKRKPENPDEKKRSRRKTS